MNNELRIVNGERQRHSAFTIHYSQFIIFLSFLFLAACVNKPATPAPLALASTNTPQPTPTLVPGLPTDPPPPTIGPSPTFTPSPTPTATPLPATRIVLGQDAREHGDWDTAVTQFEASLTEPLTDTQQIEILLDLGKTYLADGRFLQAADTFTQLLAVAAPPDGTQLLLAQSLENANEYTAAIAAYRAYLDANPEMAAYIQPRIAAAHLALGEREQAIAAYETALEGPAHRLTLIPIHRALADFYLEDGNYAAAIKHYDAIHDLATTEYTRGEMAYLAGTAALNAGDGNAAYQRYLAGVNNYPRAHESYLGLIALVEAEVPVDDFQRGLVDFYADAYDPAVAAFHRYLETNPDEYRPDTHLYLAWSYEAMGNLEAALAHLNDYAQNKPSGALIEQAKLYTRAGQLETAVSLYQEYAAIYPDAPDAPFAVWQAAELTERLGNAKSAIALYQSLADNYDWHDDAPEALFQAGWLAKTVNNQELAAKNWRQAAQNYPNADYGSASLVWLFKTAPLTTTLPSAPAPTITTTADLTATAPLTPSLSLSDLQTMALENGRTAYYPLRARDLANEIAPFPPLPGWNLPNVEDGRIAAETWLRELLELEPKTDIAQLSSILTEDNRFIIGAKLWQAGFLEEAKRELESLRTAVADDALLSYQLTLYFRDIGLYRSSILAANNVLRLTHHTVFEAPPFIGRLAYPIYYADLILPLAEQYSYDPLLQFALVRQESLFESFARSGAAAQGLAQVIPDTGAYIAQRLAWPDYENDDLYKPYVGLAFGGYYLDQQLRAFDGFTAAALSAYNAGPGNAAIWYEKAGADHDLYVETVNFAETRLYIKRIYTGYVVYRFLYEGE
ncbi:MAG: transglycosylase SLT domain-containing protein [Chloroflexi bacterium]|nr:transglycosylase SLT domain-containing protein [Chloroflexota bacterium]